MKIVNHIFRKELREMLRDKRVRSAALFGPMFMSFMIMFMFGFIIDSVAKPQNQKIHVVKANSNNAIVEGLKKSGIQITEVDSLEAGEKLIKEGKAKLVVQFEPDVTQKYAQGQLTNLVAYYDAQSEKGTIGLSIFKDVVRGLNEEKLKMVLKSQGIKQAAVRPLNIEEKAVKVGEKGAGSMIIGFLPYIIVIWAFYGGISIASDLVAGEKEKGTLETLLISPAARKEIALGKFLALSIVCLSSCLSAVAGVYIAGMLPMGKAVFKDGGIAPESIPVFLALLIPAVILFASLLLAISTFAKNTREAQTHLNLAGFAVLMPALFSQILGFTDFASSRWINFVPVLNTAAGLRNVLMGKNDWVGFGITVGVSLVLAIIAMIIAIKLFNREEVLKRV